METYYTQSHAARLLGVGFDKLKYRVSRGQLPPLRVDANGKKLWTAKDLEKIRKVLEVPLPEFRVKAGMLTFDYVSRTAKVAPETLRKWITNGHLKGPFTKIGKRTYFTSADVLHIQLLKKRNYVSYFGYYSKQQAAVKLGVPVVTLDYWIFRGQIAKPNQYVDGLAQPRYSEKDLHEIKSIKAEYFLDRVSATK